MARTAVTVTAITPTAGIAESAGTAADPTNDHVVTLPASACLEEMLFVFKNTNGTDRVATIVAGDNPPAIRAGQGDLAITVPATTGVMMIGGLESARFLQDDGTLLIDLAASFAGTVHAYRIPRTA